MEVLKYSDKKLSEFHRLSNRLGKNDLKSFKNHKGKNKNPGKDYNPNE